MKDARMIGALDVSGAESRPESAEDRNNQYWSSMVGEESDRPRERG